MNLQYFKILAIALAMFLATQGCAVFVRDRGHHYRHQDYRRDYKPDYKPDHKPDYRPGYKGY
jgi:hypothetical protein